MTPGAASATDSRSTSKVQQAIDFAHQAEKLSLHPHDGSASADYTEATTAVEAKFITPLDAVIETADGQRLPSVPVTEAHRLNQLKRQLEDDQIDYEDRERTGMSDLTGSHDMSSDATERRATIGRGHESSNQGTLDRNTPPSKTHPLFPPLPLWGPPSILRNIQCRLFRVSSFFLSMGFLGVVVLGAAFTSVPLILRYTTSYLTFRDPKKKRPFYEEEKRRKIARREANNQWKKRKRSRSAAVAPPDSEASTEVQEEYVPTEGGADKLVCDVGYYARRVGLDVEEWKVQTEDGFILDLWHVYNPREYTPASLDCRTSTSPDVFPASNGTTRGWVHGQYEDGKRRYPVLLIHGLLQSAGAYCCTDENSLAFYLCKSGYDVWLGNNRCGFKPQHTMLKYGDPRMWAWNIRQMGVMDLPAFMSRVLLETGFSKLGLVCHSQGTTQTFVALAKDQRPDLGEKISVFCALAPAAYAGPLIEKMYLKFMKIISPAMFRVFFGIHAFIPFMMTMHAYLPARLYGSLGYRVFSFLFNWSDERWELDIRDRLFQFAPVYVSAESMRWWLGREAFARHKCILATREEGQAEEEEDANAEIEDVVDSKGPKSSESQEQLVPEQWNSPAGAKSPTSDAIDTTIPHTRTNGPWYSEQSPPMALWIAGSDDLVDGRRLLRRFQNQNREPHMRLVHAKVIPEYEHLDVIWAVDMIDTVGSEVKDVIWGSVDTEQRKRCRKPVGCEEL